jgi:hypothetical protein
LFFGPGNPNNWGKQLGSADVKARDVAEQAFLEAAKLHSEFWKQEDLLGFEWVRCTQWLQRKSENSWHVA